MNIWRVRGNVDGLGSALTELVKSLQTVAPEVWRIALRQVYANVAGACLILVLCVFIIVVSAWLASGRPASGSDDGDGFWTFCAVIFLFAVIIGGWVSVGVVQRLINPEWYAIELLRSLLPR